MTSTCSESSGNAFSVSGTSPPRSTLKALQEAARDTMVQCGNRDLVALLVGSQGSRDPVALADQLLRSDGLLGLVNLQTPQLRELGASPSAALTIAVAFELCRRVAIACRAGRPVVRNARDAAALMTDLSILPHEEFWLYPLDVSSRLIGRAHQVSKGDLSSCDAAPASVLRIGLLAGASSLIVAHNHPTGLCAPSSRDIAATRSLVAAGHAVGLPVVDHVVVGHAGSFHSIRESHPDIFTNV